MNREEGSLNWNYIQEASKRQGYEALNVNFVVKAKNSKSRHEARRDKALIKFQAEFNNGYQLVKLDLHPFEQSLGWKDNLEKWRSLPDQEKIDLKEKSKITNV